MIGSVEKSPLFKLQFYFFIFKPDILTWFYSNLTLFNSNLTEFDTDLTENIPIDPVAMEFSLVLKASPCFGQGFQSSLSKLQFQ